MAGFEVDDIKIDSLSGVLKASTGNVSGAATTADLPDSADKRYITDAQQTIVGNTSGTNTGDETTATIKTKLSITTLSGSNTGDQTISDATISTTDITTNDVSTSKHGFFPKLPTPAGKFLKDDLTWQTIAGGGDMLGSNNLSDVVSATTSRNNILPSKTGNALKVLRVNAGETDYELATSSGGTSSLTGTTVLDFGNEENSIVNTISSALITNANLKGFSYLCTSTTETSLDDFTLNGVTINIENIVDSTSFDIRASAINNATGNYTIKYLVIY